MERFILLSLNKVTEVNNIERFILLSLEKVKEAIKMERLLLFILIKVAEVKRWRGSSFSASTRSQMSTRWRV
jgi:hypothetical protein